MLVHTGVIPGEPPLLKEHGKLLTYVGYLIASDSSGSNKTAIQLHSYNSGLINSDELANINDCAGTGCKRPGETDNEKYRHNDDENVDNRKHEQNRHEKTAVSIADDYSYGEWDYDGYNRRFNDNYYDSRRDEDWP